MKTLLLSALVLTSTAAFAAAPKGTKILSCDATDGSYTKLAVYHNPDGSFRASVTEESFGGSYPTFHYDVREIRSAGGEESYAGERFSLEIGRDRQGKLTLGNVSTPVDCR